MPFLYFYLMPDGDKMLTYTFEKNSRIPLYEQLYQKIKEDITTGRIAAGSRLPSKRTFSEHLGISKVTIEAAYSQLIAEGYIYSLEKKGYYAERVNIVSVAEAKIEEEPESVRFEADIKSNGVSLEHFPFSVWSRLMREVTLNYSRELMASVPYNGVLCLREAICAYLAANRGMRILPSQVVVGAGTEYLYGLIIQLLGFDKRFALENPSYSRISEVYRAHGVECIYVDMDSDGVDVKSLENSDADVIHISPAHHFPTGIVTPQKRRFEILEWAAKSENRYIIEDEYDSEFRFTGKPISPMQSADTNNKVIYINTFSKTIAPSIRISYMILPPPLAEEYKKRLSFYSCTVAAFEQYTLAKFISDGYFERHIRRMKRYYKLLRDDIIKQINQSPISDKVKITEPDSGLHFLLKIDTDKSDAEISAVCAENGIRVAFLSEYYVGGKEASEHLALINYSGIDSEDFKKALLCLEKTTAV